MALDWQDLVEDTSDLHAEQINRIAHAVIANEGDIVTAQDAADNAQSAADTAQETADRKQDAEAGKGLSTNDYDDDAKHKVDNLENNYVSKTDYSVDMAKKVDKVEGKGLSTNDYDDTAKGKVDSLDTELAKKVDKPAETVKDGSIATKTRNGVEWLEFDASNFANAIKVQASGNPVTANDVNPNEHPVKCKLTSDTITDFSAVTVKRYGANLLDKNIIRETFEGNGLTINCDRTTGIITINGTADATTTFSVSTINAEYPVGNLLALENVYVSGTVQSESLSCSSVIRMDDTISGSGRSVVVTPLKQENTINSAITNKKYISSFAYFMEAGVVFNNYKFKPMILAVNKILPYEDYIEPQTATGNADGTVEGLKSISPNMTLLSGSGVTINAEYNADTKKYIDNKFAELQAQVLSMGGNI